jgi:hypothetical protein
MGTPETGGDGDDGAIRTGFDLARFLDIKISAPKSIKSSSPFDVKVSISLFKEYAEQAQQLFEYAVYHKEKFSSFIDIGLKNLSTSQFPKDSRTQLLFYQHPQIFTPENPYVFVQKDWRTVFPGRCLIIARVRRKEAYNDFDYSLEDLKDPQKKFLETGIVASSLEVLSDSKVVEPKKPGIISVGLNRPADVKVTKRPDGTFQI